MISIFGVWRSTRDYFKNSREQKSKSLRKLRVLAAIECFDATFVCIESALAVLY